MINPSSLLRTATPTLVAATLAGLGVFACMAAGIYDGRLLGAAVLVGLVIALTAESFLALRPHFARISELATRRNG